MFFKLSRKKSFEVSAERGATMVEFSIVGVIFFVMILGILDLALSLKVRSELMYYSSRIARQLASARSLSCDGGTGCCTHEMIQTKAQTLADRTGLSGLTVIATLVSPPNKAPIVVIELQRKPPCIFCNAVGADPTRKAKSEAILEPGKCTPPPPPSP